MAAGEFIFSRRVASIRDGAAVVNGIRTVQQPFDARLPRREGMPAGI